MASRQRENCHLNKDPPITSQTLAKEGGKNSWFGGDSSGERAGLSGAQKKKKRLMDSVLWWGKKRRLLVYV